MVGVCLCLFTAVSGLIGDEQDTGWRPAAIMLLAREKASDPRFDLRADHASDHQILGGVEGGRGRRPSSQVPPGGRFGVGRDTAAGPEKLKAARGGIGWAGPPETRPHIIGVAVREAAAPDATGQLLWRAASQQGKAQHRRDIGMFMRPTAEPSSIRESSGSTGWIKVTRQQARRVHATQIVHHRQKP